MIEMRLEQAKRNFFDRQKVERAAERGLKRGLSRVMAFTRTKAISLILRHVVRRGFGAKSKVKNRDGTAPSGQPPFSHTGDVVRMIFFTWDAAAKSALAGPVLLNKPTSGALKALEYGGSGVVADKLGHTKAAQFAPHPFMRPALDEELSKLPGSVTDCIRASDAS